LEIKTIDIEGWFVTHETGRADWTAVLHQLA
jgi:hypothetical protein